MSNRTKNLYNELNVKKDCTVEDIKRSFIKLSKEFHPDINPSKDAHERFVRINEAYATLSNPLKRKQYDEHLSLTKNFHFNKRSNDASYTYKNSGYTFYEHNHKNDSNPYSRSRILLRLTLLPKAVLVTALVLVTFFSSGLEIFFLRNITENRKRKMENNSIMISVVLEQVRRQAKLFGNEEQMRRLKEGKLGVLDGDALLQEYINAKKLRRHKSK